MKTQHEVLMQDPEFRRLFAMESLAAEAAELISRLMAERGISKADLARKLGKSRSWITQLLSGKTNMTVCTLAEIAIAMDSEVRLQTQPADRQAANSDSGIYTIRETVTSFDPAGPSAKRPGYAA